MRLRISHGLGVLIAVIAALPVVKPPIAILEPFSLATPFGRWLYLGSLLVVAVGWFVTHRMEEREREKAQEVKHDDVTRRLEALQTDVTDTKERAKRAEVSAAWAKTVVADLAPFVGAKLDKRDENILGEIATLVKRLSTASSGPVTVNPGTGELVLAGHAPTVPPESMGIPSAEAIGVPSLEVQERDTEILKQIVQLSGVVRLHGAALANMRADVSPATSGEHSPQLPEPE